MAEQSIKLDQWALGGLGLWKHRPIANLSPKTIRYYEEIGLLPLPHRLENGYRDYDETDVDRVRFVAGARSLDFSLDDIQEALALREQREAPCRVVLDLLLERADEISRRCVR